MENFSEPERIARRVFMLIMLGVVTEIVVMLYAGLYS